MPDAGFRHPVSDISFQIISAEGVPIARRIRGDLRDDHGNDDQQEEFGPGMVQGGERVHAVGVTDHLKHAAQGKKRFPYHRMAEAYLVYEEKQRQAMEGVQENLEYVSAVMEIKSRVERAQDEVVKEACGVQREHVVDALYSKSEHDDEIDLPNPPVLDLHELIMSKYFRKTTEFLVKMPRLLKKY